MRKPQYKPGSFADTVRRLYFEEKKSEDEIAKLTNKTKEKVHYQVLSIQRRERKYKDFLESLNQQKLFSENSVSNKNIPEKEVSEQPSKKSSEKETKVRYRETEVELTSNGCRDLSSFIPSTEYEYIPRKIGKKDDISILETAFDNKQFALLIGETGTGKTHLIRHLALKKKMPYARINLNGGTTADELIGHWVPDNEGGFRWQDGLLTIFVRNGGIIALDEVNACPAEILMALHSLTDDERMIVLQSKDGEVVKAHKNFYLACSMNPDYEGTKPLNEAFKDRFPIKIFFDYSEKVEKKLIKDDVLRRLAKRLRKMKEVGEITTPVSTRQLLYFVENKESYGYDTALEFFLNNFESHEKQPIKDVIEMLDGTGDKGSNKSKEDNPLPSSRR